MVLQALTAAAAAVMLSLSGITIEPTAPANVPDTPGGTATVAPTATPTANSTVTTTEPAYFEVRFTSLPTVTLVIRLDSDDVIAEARAILDSGEPRSVMGLIVKASAPYNPPWSYHLDPATIGFFEFATEVCDANPLYLEEHLDEACGSFLPDCRWCPWSSYLHREIPPPDLITPTGTTTAATEPSPSKTPIGGTPPYHLFLPMVANGRLETDRR